MPAGTGATSGADTVACSINGVNVLSKSVDDCEKAGGEVANLGNN